jgi:hypothetical protein
MRQLNAGIVKRVKIHSQILPYRNSDFNYEILAATFRTNLQTLPALTFSFNSNFQLARKANSAAWGVIWQALSRKIEK